MADAVPGVVMRQYISLAAGISARTGKKEAGE